MREGWDERERGHVKSEWRGRRRKSEKTDRKNRRVIVSPGKQKRSQFTELHCLRWGHGRPCVSVCVVKFWHTHTLVSCSLQCVCVALYVAESGHLSIEEDWSFHGTWVCWWACLMQRPSFDTGTAAWGIYRIRHFFCWSGTKDYSSSIGLYR